MHFPVWTLPSGQAFVAGSLRGWGRANGGSQAVRLPKGCRFPDDQSEVVVRKVGRRVVLEPVDAWPESFLACIGGWKEEIPRPKSDPLRTIKDPFA